MCINYCAVRKLVVPDLLIKEKLNRLLLAQNEAHPPHNHSKISFYNCWLYTFKKRNGFRRLVLLVVSNSAALESLDNSFPEILEWLVTFAPEYIYNADELGNQCFLAPTRTIRSTQLCISEKDKTRITFI